jgi:hypothetical protein
MHQSYSSQGKQFKDDGFLISLAPEQLHELVPVGVPGFLSVEVQHLIDEFQGEPSVLQLGLWRFQFHLSELALARS